jgi:MSHA biogenesis protein MshK
MRKRYRIAVAWSAIMLAQLPVSAETLVDPTRPPARFGNNQAMNGEPSGPVLQSILISPSRRIAIISGKTLKAGDKFGDSQLVSISENEVVLQTGKERQTLKMYPSLRRPASINRAGSNLNSPGQQR